MPAIDIRLATPEDVDHLKAMIPRSVRALSRSYYDGAQIEAALRHVFGIDSILIADGSYFLASIAGVLAGCGGWSRRDSLYGGDQGPAGTQALLRPGRDAARIRAFFIAPEFARLGVGRALFEHARAAALASGFTRLELVATLPGVPFYLSLGFDRQEDINQQLPGGIVLAAVRMSRAA